MMQLPDDIEQRLLDGYLDLAAMELEKRNGITRDEADGLIRRWVWARRQAAAGAVRYDRRKAV
jgi:hypothetical protein